MTSNQNSIFYSVPTPRIPSTKKIERITLGDLICASLCIGEQKIAEIVCDTISDLSQLFEQLRERAHKYSGLALLHIRNVTRNWERHRPFMLYPDRDTEWRRQRACRAYQQQKVNAPEYHSEARKGRMAFPWETH